MEPVAGSGSCPSWIARVSKSTRPVYVRLSDPRAVPTDVSRGQTPGHGRTGLGAVGCGAVVRQVVEQVGACEHSDGAAALGHDHRWVARREVGEDGVDRLADLDGREGWL